MAQLRAIGGNTIRLWSTDYAAPLLDKAQQQNLTVMLGLSLELESKTFSYYDPAKVQAQLERVREQVLRYRRHPALLCWNIANELEISSSSPRFYEALNQIALLIHELDPYHPVTVSQADFAHHAVDLKRWVPALDFLSVNTYSPLRILPALLRASQWDGPYVVTEYGGRGFWEAFNNTTWEAPVEQSSTAKAAFMRLRYEQAIQRDSSHCMGSYIFFWGSKFEYTPTWFSLFEPTGEKTALVDELQQLWQGHYPANRAPRLTELRLAGVVDTMSPVLLSGAYYPAVVTAADPEGDSLTTRWEVLPELPSQVRGKRLITPPEAVLGCIEPAHGRQVRVRMPPPGTYRLFVRVFDGHGSVATANIPFKVVAQPSPTY
nr:glycoside hydrolase family 2 TIM barrel-domain containing protein [Hymenobacter sp. BT559]